MYLFLPILKRVQYVAIWYLFWSLREILIPLADGRHGVWGQWSEPKTREVQVGCMWACHGPGSCLVPVTFDILSPLGCRERLYQCGRALNWERILLADGRPEVWCQWSESKTRGVQVRCMLDRVTCTLIHVTWDIWSPLGHGSKPLTWNKFQRFLSGKSVFLNSKF